VSYLATAAVGHRAAERAGANGHDKEIHVRLSVHATLLVRGTAGAGVANREDIASPICPSGFEAGLSGHRSSSFLNPVPNGGGDTTVAVEAASLVRYSETDWGDKRPRLASLIESDSRQLHITDSRRIKMARGRRSQTCRPSRAPEP
jgi:hypothetical protein